MSKLVNFMEILPRLPSQANPAMSTGLGSKPGPQFVKSSTLNFFYVHTAVFFSRI
jgi:hypothetical protein